MQLENIFRLGFNRSKFYNRIYPLNMSPDRGIWMAQSGKLLTLDFISGSDLRVVRSLCQAPC